MKTAILKKAAYLLLASLPGTCALWGQQIVLPDQAIETGESAYEMHLDSLKAHAYIVKADATAVMISKQSIKLKPGFKVHANGYFHGLVQPSLAVAGGGGDAGGGDAPRSAGLMGATAGNFSVNESGAANYTIPITVSPGTGGMEPQLALAYSSMGQSGLLGAGWSLAGLSSISRGRATLAQDGFIDGVDFDANDRFILDGQRLMVVSGTYGADGSEYRTEQDTFRKIIAYGQQGSGPQKFKVWSKDGLIYEYGFTESARLEAQGKSSVMVWSVNKISDTKGNYLRFIYFKDTTITHQHIDRIEYTGNSAAGLSPYNTVIFKYEYHPTSTSYLAGSKIENPYRMKRIVAQHQGETVRSYTLYYENKGATRSSYLTAVQECGSDGKCFEATRFDYPPEASAFNKTTISNAYGMNINDWQYSERKLHVLDYNGDGISDLLLQGKTDDKATYLLKGTGTGFIKSDISHQYGMHPDGWYTSHRILHLLDINGDGLQDILLQGKKDDDDHIHSTYLLMNNGNGFDNRQIINDAYGMNRGAWDAGVRALHVLDYNGDGRSDILLQGVTDRSTYLLESTGTGFTKSVITNAYGMNSGDWSPEARTLHVLNYNGDGKSDLLLQGKTDRATYLLESTGTGFSRTVITNSFGMSHSDWSSERQILHVTDYNGDGMSDLLLQTKSKIPPQTYLLKNTGTGFIKKNISMEYGMNPHWWSSYRTKLKLLDVNGDGLQDILLQGKQGDDGVHASFLLMNNGNGFSDAQNITDAYGMNGNDWNSARRIFHILDYNGDGAADILMQGKGINLPPYINKQYDAYLLTNTHQRSTFVNKITNGLGVETTVSYQPLTDTLTYTKGTTATYPRMDFQGAMYVVSSYEQTNGIGGKNKISYRYGDAKVNLEGRGFRGFGRMEITDHATEMINTIIYERDYKCISSKVRRTETRTLAGTLLAETDNHIVVQEHGPGVHFSYVDSSATKQYELDGSLVNTTITTSQMDHYGNVTDLLVNHGEGFSTRTVSTYTNNTTTWHLGRLTRSEVTQTGSGQSITNVSTFAYNAGSGLLVQEVIVPGNASLQLEKNYTYDAFGNITYSEARGVAGQVRTQTTTFDSRGRFVLTSTNALGHSETRTYEPLLGLVASQTGPNGLTTTRTYDGMGRMRQERRADGTETTISYNNCGGGCPASASYFVNTVSSGSSPAVAYFDVLGREVRRERIGFDGTEIYTDTEYNAKGQAVKMSDPYFNSDTPLWTTMVYDLAGRVTSQTAPGSRTTATTYNGRITTITNALGQQNTRVVNAPGQVITRTDNNGESLTYTYTAHRQLKTVTDPAGNTTTMTYDRLGKKLSITTPNTGTTTYQYNAFGELTRQTDAKGQTVTMAYDLLGRMTTRTEPEGTTTWVYDSGNKAIGKLTKVTSPNGSEESYVYDHYGRTSSQTIKESITGKTFTTLTTYDAYSRPLELIYPSGFAIANAYNAQGYLYRTVRQDDGSVVWEAGTMNARRQLERQKLGSHLTTYQTYHSQTGLIDRITTNASATTLQDQQYTFNAIGNLTVRKDQLQGSLQETFSYDGLNRLTTNQISGGTINYTNITTYDKLGNITYRSDVGCYVYGESAGPHAITTLKDVSGNVLSTYTYDANGNRLTHTGGSVSYTSFNKPIDITTGTNTLHFEYGPNRNRLYQTVADGDSLITARWYAGGIYEEEEDAAGAVKKIHYLAGGSGTVAIYTESSTGTTTTDYLLKDHLGSIYRILGADGTVKETLSYNPWGQRRQANWVMAFTPITSSFHRGFTGHEMLEAVALVHMNGRIYDPLLGRFLSADPFVQMPENLQSYNRYSYVLNNPLSLTDPSGFLVDGLEDTWDTVVNTLANAFESVFGGTNTDVQDTDATSSGGGDIVSGAGTGLGQSFEGTLANGGSIGDACSPMDHVSPLVTFDGIYVETTDTGQRFYGVNIESNAEGCFGDVSGSISTLSLGYEGYIGEGGIHSSADASMAEARRDTRLGSENNNIGIEGEVSLAKLEAGVTAGLYDGQSGKYGYELDGTLGAYALKSEVIPSFTIFGVKIGVTMGVSLKSAHMGGRFAGIHNSNTREFESTAMIHAGLGVGLKLGFTISNVDREIVDSRRRGSY